MITARPLTAEELNELATRAAAAVSMGLQAADDTQARMLATITQLAEQYSELHRQNGLLRGERDQACEELKAMREEPTLHSAFKILVNPMIGSDEWGVLAMCECGRGYAFGNRATGEELLAFLADHEWTRPNAAEEGDAP